MFTTENSEFTGAQCTLANAAVTILVARGIEQSNACDIVNNRWIDGENTVESLAGAE